MDKLEEYLDQVCRRIGGVKSMRQHIRQELREHLLDAAAQRRAAGLSEQEALAHALDDFGRPEQVRSELEATHGHRLMAVVVDKALEWKERTMKARWLWTTWAHLALAGVIAVEFLFFSAAMIFIVPKYIKFLDEGWIDAQEPQTRELVSETIWCLREMNQVGGSWWMYLVPLAVGWGLFEWRMRSENKSLIRLSAMGTAALALMAAVLLTGSALVIPMTVALDTMNQRIPEPIVHQHVTKIDVSVGKLRQAIDEHDWRAIREHSGQALLEMDRLARMGAAAPVLESLHEQSKVDDLRAQLKSANENLLEARIAQSRWDMKGQPLPEGAARFQAAMQRFNAAYAQVKAAAATEK